MIGSVAFAVPTPLNRHHRRGICDVLCRPLSAIADMRNDTRRHKTVNGLCNTFLQGVKLAGFRKNKEKCYVCVGPKTRSLVKAKYFALP
jgi:ATP/ADP translocase